MEGRKGGSGDTRAKARFYFLDNFISGFPWLWNPLSVGSQHSPVSLRRNFWPFFAPSAGGI